MKKVFKCILDWLNNGEDVVFSTIVADSGSAPRGTGAHMGVIGNGDIVGTIGGGAVEYRVQQMSAEILKDKRARLEKFILSPNEVADLGMICGGNITVRIDYFSHDNADLKVMLKESIDLFDKNIDSWLVLSLAEKPQRLTMATYTDKSDGDKLNIDLSAIDKLPKKGEIFELNGIDYYIEPLTKTGKVYVFGGGHVSREVVPVLSHVGFDCVVFDDKAEFAKIADFPTAQQLIVGDFGKIYDYINITDKDYVVLLTRGHVSDYTVQRQVMEKGMPYYLGVIGSRKKTAVVFDKLRKDGISESDLQKVHTPIGLPIKGGTPEEIAISIAAEMILKRAEKLD